MIVDTKYNDILEEFDKAICNGYADEATLAELVAIAYTNALVAIANELAALNENVVWLARIMPRG